MAGRVHLPRGPLRRFRLPEHAPDTASGLRARAGGPAPVLSGLLLVGGFSALLYLLSGATWSGCSPAATPALGGRAPDGARAGAASPAAATRAREVAPTAAPRARSEPPPETAASGREPRPPPRALAEPPPPRRPTLRLERHRLRRVMRSTEAPPSRWE